jgi:hypothetical protein
MLKTVPHNLEEYLVANLEALRGPNGVPTIPPSEPNLVQSPGEPSEDPMHA